jgi:hypothetical protein
MTSPIPVVDLAAATAPGVPAAWNLSASTSASSTTPSRRDSRSRNDDPRDTGFHDHDGSAVGVYMLRGSVTNEGLPIGGSRRVHRYGPGDSFSVPGTGIHRTNHDAGAVTVHIYSPPLRAIGYYEIVDGLLQRTPGPPDEASRQKARDCWPPSRARPSPGPASRGARPAAQPGCHCRAEPWPRSASIPGRRGGAGGRLLRPCRGGSRRKCR